MPEPHPEVELIQRRLRDRVHARRQELGWTWSELARRSGLSLRTVAELEAGRANLAIGRVAMLARALMVPVEFLVAEAPAVLPEAAERTIGLVGMRGAGKTTLGTRLADRLHRPFVELDAAIERRAGLSLAELFSLHGEAWYRRLERACVDEVLQAGEPVVVALSGGIVSNGDTWAVLRQRCLTVWLRATPEEHMDRVLAQGDRRPVHGREDAMEELRILLALRTPSYLQADVCVDTTGVDRKTAMTRLLDAVLRSGVRLS